MLAKAIELGELIVEDPARSLVNLFTWVTLDSEPKARSMAAMRAFDLPKDSPHVTHDAIDWWVGRRRKTIETPSIKLSKHRKASGLDDEARTRLLEGESILKVLAADPAQGLKDAVLFGHTYRFRAVSHAGSAELYELETLGARDGAGHRQGVHRDRARPRVPAQHGLRPDHPARRAAREALGPPGRAEHRCAQAPDRGQPAPGGVDRQEVHRARHELPGPHPGGQHRPHPGGREVRLREGLQVQHLRHVVDPPGDHARHRRPGAHDPHPGPHGRDHQPPHPRQPHPAPGAGS